MKMILAVNNKNLEEKLINKYYTTYEIYVAKNVGLISKLLCDNCIIIFRYELANSKTVEQIIINIREKYNNIQFIMIIKSLTKQLKEFFFSKEIFNIIEGTSFSFDSLVDMISYPKMIVYKENKLNESSNVVIITGGFSTGKSIVSVALSRYISVSKKVLLIDMDFIHPTIDLYANASKNYSIGEFIQNLKNNSSFNLNNYITKDNKVKNLNYILNRGEICIPSEDIMINMIEKVRSYFDYIIIDTSSFMIKKVYDVVQKKDYKIIHIIEPDNRGFKNYIEDIRYIDKDAIFKAIIILNKCISKLRVKKFEEKYKMKNSIYIKMSYMYMITGKLNFILFYNSIKKIANRLKIKKDCNIKKYIKGGIRNE